MAQGSDKPSKIGLYFFGIVEILIGLLFLLIALTSLFIPKIPPLNPQVPMPSFLPVSLFAFAFSTFVIAMGVGTIMAKRWARKIMLILSWYGLGLGLVGILFFIFFMGSFLNTAFSNAPNITPAVASGMKMGMMVMMAVFYVILPGVFVLFYQSKRVLAAVEYYDPKENWMDACPTPVFAVSFICAFGAVGMGILGLMVLSTNLPFFGAVFPVWGIALFLLVMFSALTYISIGFYHLEVKAWWAALILVILGSAAAFFMFKLIDPMSAYQRMNVPAAQIDQMKKSGALDMYKSMPNVSWIMMVPYLAYLLFIRKYFFKDASK